MRRRGWRRVVDYDRGARIVIEYELRGREVVDYAVVLVVEFEGADRTVRLYDGAHGINEMHRHTLGRGKEPAEVFHAGTLGEGMRIAIDAIQSSYTEMIEAWRAS